MTSSILRVVRLLFLIPSLPARFHVLPRGWPVFVMLLLPPPATALPEEGNALPQKIHQLSLEEIIRLGLEASPKLWEQRHVIDQAEAQLGQAKAGRLPRMDYLQIAGLIQSENDDVPLYSGDLIAPKHRKTVPLAQRFDLLRIPLMVVVRQAYAIQPDPLGFRDDVIHPG